MSAPWQVLLFALLGCSSGALRTAHFSAPLSWLDRARLNTLCDSGRLQLLQMLVLSNTEGGGRMELGMDAVDVLLESCPELCALGNLR